MKRRYASKCSSGLPGNRVALALGEQVAQRQIDRPHGAVKINRAKQLRPHADKLHQRRQAAMVNRQAVRAEEAVVQQSLEIERPGVVARHIGVAEHEIHVVDGVDAAEQAAQQNEPARHRRRGGSGRAGDQQHDLFRIESLVGLQPAVRIAAHAREQIAQFVPDDVAAQRFVGQAEIGQKVFVEKMAERSVPHVVQQAGHAEQRFDIASAGHVGADLAQAVVQCGGRPAGQVHHAQDVLEARVFGRWINPPGGLQLMDLPQPLDPGMVDDLPFGDFALGQPDVGHERYIAVNGVVAEVFTTEIAHRNSLTQVPSRRVY